MSHAGRGVPAPGRFFKKIKPDILVECNFSNPPGSNSAINRGAWAPWIYPHGDLFWSEEPNEPGRNHAGILGSRIRSFKMGQATQNAVFTYNNTALAVAEAMAFNRNCLGMIGSLTALVGGQCPSSAIRPLIDFFRERNDLFRTTDSAAEVAVLYAYPTLSYLDARPHLELVLAEQCLIQGHIPYDIVFDHDLSSLARYRAVVLPCVEFLPDQALERIRDYVRAGGGLVMTGTTSMGTESGFIRKPALFDDLIQRDIGKLANGAALEIVQRTYGRGRVWYLSRLKPPVQPEYLPPAWYRTSRFYDNRWWQLPLRYADFIAGVRWASDGLWLEMDAPETVVVELRRQANPRRALLHLLKYASGAVAQVVGRIPAAALAGDPAWRISAPEAPAPRLSVEGVEAGRVKFSVTGLQTYAVVEISLAPS